ncbi:hypothetical protein BGW36DRAFT_366468 [Talaromyces proteolyticus]|uniref:Flavin-nucleotide-binding protein n=1 Tax=Talaromyces proteolyticus TaxID=1131652 RepID=A0AAD4L1L0_9EURO|nr:uncharacterized protein BGW36DRAFT_366468 [Talaromyces proteolyticus]KAH8704931.1 hypothetical protein BGW36DRAFT_366468 [Talaromyces proteolyticus]
MGRTLTYPKRSTNTVKRYGHRATYDIRAIHSIINTSQVLHVSFSPGPDEPFPATIPMIGQMGSFEYPSADLGEPLDCYIHGYVSARMMNIARDSEEGLPVCISAAKVDGLIMSLTPFSHSYNYRSAILHGYAKLVTDDEEKSWAMKLITDSVVPQRWDNSRTPPDKGELASTSILKVKIVTGSGKIRDGAVSDEKKDYQNEEVTNRVWTGVIPVHEVFGEPIPSPANKVKELPGYIRSYIDTSNQQNEQYAVSATNIELPKEEQH